MTDLVPILTTQTGSELYGINSAEVSDTDYVTVAVAPKTDVLGLSPFESKEERTAGKGERSTAGDIDHTTYSLRKFLQLAAVGNPSIITLLFAPSRFRVHTTPSGQALLLSRNTFLSKEAGYRFLGYMRGQRDRLIDSRAGVRALRVNRSELIEKHGYDTKYAGHLIRLGLSGIELMQDGWINLPMEPEARAQVLEVRSGKLPFDAVIEMAADLESELENKIQSALLPKRTDREQINKLSVLLHEAAWCIDSPQPLTLASLQEAALTTNKKEIK